MRKFLLLLVLIAIIMIASSFILFKDKPDYTVNTTPKNYYRENKIDKEHCIDNLCVFDIIISRKGNNEYIIGKVKNTGSKNNVDKYLKITFNDNNNYYFIKYSDEYLKDDIMTFKITVDKVRLLKEKDYNLSFASEKEIKEYNNS